MQIFPTTWCDYTVFNECHSHSTDKNCLERSIVILVASRCKRERRGENERLSRLKDL